MFFEFRFQKFIFPLLSPMISRWAESRRYHVRIFSVVCFYAFAMFLKINRKSQYFVCFCVVFRMATKRKHNKATLKTKYEALKELEKNRPNKEVALQFNVPGSTLLLLEKKKQKNLPSFSKFILEMTKSQSGNIWKDQLYLAEMVYISVTTTYLSMAWFF